MTLEELPRYQQALEHKEALRGQTTELKTKASKAEEPPITPRSDAGPVSAREEEVLMIK